MVYYRYHSNDSLLVYEIELKDANIAENIVKMRKERGWTQTDLAEKSGVAYATVVKLEQGLLTNPTLKTLGKLKEVFGVSLDELIKS